MTFKHTPNGDMLLDETIHTCEECPYFVYYNDNDKPGYLPMEAECCGHPMVEYYERHIDRGWYDSLDYIGE